MLTTHQNTGRRPAQGLAALSVVMALFFVLALVAAYTNRNLVFEQRMSAGSVRAERAVAAADAGGDWAVAMLNAGRLDANCNSSNNVANTDFRRRYLSLNRDDGSYGINTGTDVGLSPLFPACQMQGGTMSCACPEGNDIDPAIPNTDPNASGFRLSFIVPAGSTSTPPGTVILQIRGCANTGTAANACQSRTRTPDSDAISGIRVNLGLLQALPVPPHATLTAGGTINGAAADLMVANADANTGLALHAGQAITQGGASQVNGPAGAAPGSATLAGDAKLDQLVTNGRFFASLFGMSTALYQRQPGVVRINCAAGCNTASLDAANWLTGYAGRVVWIEGNLNLNAAPAGGVAGDDTNPIMLVVNGTLTVSAAVPMVGFVAANNIVWTGGANGASLRGAMVAGVDFTADAQVNMAYDATVLETIRLSYGSFVRVPGGWNRDGSI